VLDLPGFMALRLADFLPTITVNFNAGADATLSAAVTSFDQAY